MCREPRSEDAHVPKDGGQGAKVSPTQGRTTDSDVLLELCTSENAIHLGLVFKGLINIHDEAHAPSSLALVIKKSLETLTAFFPSTSSPLSHYIC